MARNNTTNNDEPITAPEPDRWYDITLGPSFNDHHTHPSSKFCTLRYEFKPASIDKSKPGSLHKGKNKKVTVEYHNNQYGKPKVTFEGVSEDYKGNDAVLFFEQDTFRMERLHRAVKRLRHVRLPGETAATMGSATLVAPVVENYSPPVSKATNQQSLNKGIASPIPAQVEQVNTSGSESLEPKEDKTLGSPSHPPGQSVMSLELKDFEAEEDVDIVNVHDDGYETANREHVSGKGSRTGLDIDINLPHQVDMDDEIADVDISDNETDKGQNAAEALRAQVNAEVRKEQDISSSSSSESDSSASENGSGSGSGSSSSRSARSESVEIDSI